MYRFLLITTILFSLLLLLPAQKAQAADCPIVYGGGKVDCNKLTPTATPVPTQPVTNTKPAASPKPATLPTQTKGGLPINKPVQTTTAPATGPEAFGLIGLLPAAAAGFWLRRKRI